MTPLLFCCATQHGSMAVQSVELSPSGATLQLLWVAFGMKASQDGHRVPCDGVEYSKGEPSEKGPMDLLEDYRMGEGIPLNGSQARVDGSKKVGTQASAPFLIPVITL